jgi:hypothetical protein
MVPVGAHTCPNVPWSEHDEQLQINGISIYGIGVVSMLTMVLDCDSMSQYYTVWPPAGPPSGCPSRRLLRPLTRTGPPVHERSHERGHVHDRFCVRKVHERLEADVDRRRKCVYTAISFWKTHLQLVAYIGGRIQWCWVQHARASCGPVSNTIAVDYIASSI